MKAICELLRIASTYRRASERAGAWLMISQFTRHRTARQMIVAVAWLLQLSADSLRRNHAARPAWWIAVVAVINEIRPGSGGKRSTLNWRLRSSFMLINMVRGVGRINIRG